MQHLSVTKPVCSPPAPTSLFGVVVDSIDVARDERIQAGDRS